MYPFKALRTLFDYSILTLCTQRERIMYEYHGWLSTFEAIDVDQLIKELKDINGDYPVSAQYVNGKLHISFSGSPNRDLGLVGKLVTHLCNKRAKLSGCVYINDPNSDRYNKFDVIKIIQDKVTEIPDRNFTDEETNQLFE